MRSRLKTFGFFMAAVLSLHAPSAVAGVSDRVMFDYAPSAKYQVVEAGQGFQTLLIATNAPFDVRIEGVIGEVNVDVTTSGQINGQPFGTRAQLPGLSEATVMVASPFETVVYESDFATASSRGSLRAQAVRLTLTYDPLADPEISIEPQD